jgi:hypothetical protein
MTRTITSLRTAAGALLGDRRDIGPLGTASRIAGGLIAIALPIALGGFGWWDAAAALVGLPLVATGAATLITAAYQRLAPEGLARGHAVCSGPACWLSMIMVGTAVGLDVLTPTGVTRSAASCTRRSTGRRRGGRRAGWAAPAHAQR